MAHDLPMLRSGSKGDEVKSLQNALRAQGYDPGATDGVFGAQTERAVREFQGDFDLDVDGIVGPDTWGALGVYVVESGDTLSGIAEELLGDADRWPEIVEVNDGVIRDPDRIFPGQVLAIPA